MAGHRRATPKDDPTCPFEDVLDLDWRPRGDGLSGPKATRRSRLSDRAVVRLSRVWGCSPVALRDLTLEELGAMGEVLPDEARRAR